MLDEYYIACALPHSLARDADFHVSLFFSPTIRPSAPTTLAASSLFLDWATALRANPQLLAGSKHLLVACKKVIKKLEAIPRGAGHKRREGAYQRIIVMCQKAIEKAEH